MFNLGFKEVIINSDADITNVGGTITGSDANVDIEGVIHAGDGDISKGIKVSSVPAVKGNATVTDVAAGVYTLKYTVKSVANERITADIFSYGDKKLMQITVAASLGVDGNLEAMAFEDAGLDLAATFTNAAGNLVITAKEDGFSIVDVELINDVDVDLAVVTYVAGSIGVGLGSQVEAEVKNATFDNIDPYGVRFGGSAIVDVRGTYTQFILETKGSNKWESHESTGYGLNGSSNKDTRQLILWINEVSAAASITALTAMIV